MFCPKCAHEKTIVCGTVKGIVNERWRKCTVCGYTFSTVEAIKFDDYWREYAKESSEFTPQSKEQRHKKD